MYYATVLMFSTSMFDQVDDSQKMGTKRVDLSEYSSTHHSRTYTMPEKVSTHTQNSN